MKKLIILMLAIVMSSFSVSSHPQALSENNINQNLIATISAHPREIECMALSPDGKILASGSGDKTIKLWNVESRSEIATLSGHSGFVGAVAFSPDGRILASGSEDKKIKLWDVESHKEIFTLSGHTSWVCSVTFSPDGKILASGSFDNKIKLWDVKNHGEIATLDGHSDYVRSIAFNPDGKILASGGSDKTIKLWDVDKHSEIATLTRHLDEVNSVAFSPDGRILTSGSDDKTIKLWDVESRSEIATLSGHSHNVDSVAFSPDGRILASGSFDKTIKLWDMESRSEIAALSGHSDYVISIIFSPDGKVLFSGSYDATIKLWDMEPYIAELNAPEVSQIPDQIIEKGQAFAPIRLDGYVFDWDNTDNELIWTYKGNSDLSVSIGHEHIATITPTDLEWVGSEIITFIATDPNGKSDSDQVTFQVNAKGSPILFLYPENIDFGPDITGNLFTIGNLGNEALKWEIASDDVPKWADIFPSSGINAPGEELSISINLNKQGLLAGQYTHDILVNSNGGSRRISVKMRVDKIVAMKPHSGKWSGKNDDGKSVSFEVSEDGSVVKDFSTSVSYGGSFLNPGGYVTSNFSKADIIDNQFAYDIHKGKFDSIFDASGSWSGYVRTYSGGGGLVTVTAHYSSGSWTATYSGLAVSDIPHQTIPEGAAFASFNMDNYVSDPKYKNSEMVWKYNGNSQLKVDISHDRIATVTAPSVEWIGSETITFTVTNPDGSSESDDAKFTVIPRNIPPLVSNIPDQVIGLNMAFVSIHLDNYVSDADNLDDEITWVCVGNRQLKVDINDARVATVMPLKPAWSGSEIITFIARDPVGLGQSDTVMFTVLPIAMLYGDVTRDGIVNAMDMVVVGQNFGKRILTPLDPNPDINGDGVVDILDLVLVGKHFGETYTPASPSKDLWSIDTKYLPILNKMYAIMENSPDSDPNFIMTKNILYRLISGVKVPNTKLSQNYPNPFNPETWIPYQLSENSDLVIRIYDASGKLVKTLDLGYNTSGFYTIKDKAAYWDGKNEAGEHVASGIYFYTIHAGDFTDTRKMLISR